jgi:abortive infection bacteriophage resistance protein
MTKPAFSISDQIALLKQRGMLFKDERKAHSLLKNINYYRLKGYWWDMQRDTVSHSFQPHVYFEDILERYDFDRKLRLILFSGIEQIEIAVRTRLIYHLSLAYGGLWYLNPVLFETALKQKNGVAKTTNFHTLEYLQK